MSLLTVSKLTKNFGGLSAVSLVNMTFSANELVGVIGPNGAGKTTLFNLLTGVYEPTEGTITLETDDRGPVVLNGKKPYQISDLGITRTFQNIRLFRDMTVLENVAVAMHSKERVALWHSLLRTPRFYRQEAEMKERAMALLAIFGLEQKWDTAAKNLSYGEQRRLEIVRALATKPKLLFLDEPAAGMNPQETAELTDLIRKIQREFNTTVVLIEHDMSLVMSICQRLYVLEYGRLLAHGTPDEIKNNPDVIKAYLGGE